ncbi:hypothetical protein HS088_TW14G00966 [Tripterygium wilfordii]|uniref:Uncharacterized protein n=1 Tax=Tripterygium wilfordii TaxID=458696 RepID=A0A7J7CRR3_TRIWF|nr:hypothetical protein HS088_TW14G00966 [Tripterygium wilfordii]
MGTVEACKDLTISSSTSRTETINGNHEFRITGYSLNKGMGIGKYVQSETFVVGGYEWAIYFYPDGKSPEDNASYVSLFIALASDGTDVRALFELTLVDQSGKNRHKVHSHFGRALESGPYSLKYRGSMWGFKRFFKRSMLETSDYLKDDCLLIRCRVGVVRSQTEGPKTYSITVPPSDIGQHFGQLLESGKGADVIFEVNGENFPAHKLVLAARSPVFKAQLFGPMKDINTECIDIEDMEAPVFKDALSTNLRLESSVKALILYTHCHSSEAVMQTDGFRHLKDSCPSVLTELLQYVARVGEHSATVGSGKDSFLDGCDMNDRRVKQRFR